MSVGKRESDIELGEGSLPPPPASPARPSTQTPRSSRASQPAAASRLVAAGAAGAGAPSSPVADPRQTGASWTGSRPPGSALAGRRSCKRVAGPAEICAICGQGGDPPSSLRPAQKILHAPSTCAVVWLDSSQHYGPTEGCAAACCKLGDTVEQAPAQQVGQETSVGRGRRAR